jgi:membrane protein DedA with SNARE-associated domain
VSPLRATLVLVVIAAAFPGPDELLALVARIEDTAATFFMLALATPFVSELAPIVGGLASHEGRLPLGRVIAAATLGGWIGTAVLYVAGRFKWEWVRRRAKSVRAAGTVALRIVARNPARASFLVRFLFGARILLPMACGAARVPLGTYLPMSLLGSLAWSATFAFVGLLAGEAAQVVLANIRQVERGLFLAAGVLALLVLGWWWRRRQRRAARRLARERGSPTA